MRVGIVIDSNILGGIQKIAIKETELLNKLGFKVDLIVLDSKTNGFPDNTIFLLDHVKLPKIRIPPFDHLALHHIILHKFKVIKNIMKEYDILLAHNIIAGYFVYKIYKKFGIPYILYIHDPACYIIDIYNILRILKIPKLIIKKIERMVLEEASALITNSKKTANLIKEEYNVDSIVLYPGAEVLKDVYQKDIDILFCTRWNKRRNLNLVIKVAETFSDKRVYVIGIWDNEKDYKDFIQMLQKEKIYNITIINKKLEEKELLTYYKRSKIYIQTEPVAYGMGAIEALLNDCIPLVWKESGVAEILITEGLDNLLVDSERDIIQKVGRLFENNNEYIQILSKVDRIKDKYNWKSHAIRLLELIMRIVK